MPYDVQNWPAMLFFLVLTSVSFCLFGFILGVLADGFEKLQIVPMLILTPLTFLGGTFYSIDMLPEPWRTITLFNPIVYLISGFRWAFFGAEAADVNIGVSLAAIALFLTVCLATVWWIFKTGYRLKNWTWKANAEGGAWRRWLRRRCRVICQPGAQEDRHPAATPAARQRKALTGACTKYAEAIDSIHVAS